MKTPYDTIESTGKEALRFQKGGLHESLDVPSGKKIPAAKRIAALKGKMGAKAKRQAMFQKNVLTGGK